MRRVKLLLDVPTMRFNPDPSPVTRHPSPPITLSESKGLSALLLQCRLDCLLQLRAVGFDFAAEMRDDLAVATD
jgi:hypothetical protein